MNQFDKSAKGLKLQALKKILNLSIPAIETVLRKKRGIPQTRIGQILDKTFNECILNLQKEPSHLFKDHNFPKMLEAYRKAFVYIADIDGAYRGHLAYALNILFIELMNAQVEFGNNIMMFSSQTRFKNFNIHNQEHQKVLFYLWLTEAKGEYDFSTTQFI